MRNKLLAKFNHCRDDIILALFELVNKLPNKHTILKEEPNFYEIVDDGRLFQIKYKMIAIKGKELLVYYSSFEGINQNNKIEYCDDIFLFSLDEIFHLIGQINE